MKKIILFSIVCICLISCVAKKQTIFTNLDCSPYAVLDSLGYIEKTEDGLFTGKVFNNIKKIGKDLAPCLIEKLKDTTSTDYRYADFCNFSTGDFALFMLPYTLDKENDENNIYKDVIIKEFDKKYFIKDMFYQDIQTTLFHLHDKKTNYKNRLKLHKKLKKWYLKKYKN